MQLKKLLQGSAFALVAAACAIAVPSVAKAEVDGKFTEAGLDATTVKWDGEKAELTVKTATPQSGQKAQSEIMVGFAKIDKNKNVKVTSWDVYDGDTTSGTTATIDLSKLSNVKDNYIAITTPSKDVAVVKIPATDKVTKAKFDAQKGELQVGSGANASAATPKALTYDSTSDTTKADREKSTAICYEYRTAYSDWQDCVESTTSGSTTTTSLKKFNFYQQEGTKLFVRLKAQAPTALTTQGDEELKYGEQKVKVYEAGKLPGKEAKVTIAAKAKGPKVTADYVKGTVKFPKKSQYRLVSANGIIYKTDSTKELYTADTKKVSELLADAKGTATGAAEVTEANVEVRTIASTKKPESKWSTLKIEAPRKLLVENSGTIGDTSFIFGTNRMKFSGTGRKDGTGTPPVSTTNTLKEPAKSTDTSYTDWVGKGEAGVKDAGVTETFKEVSGALKPDQSANANVLKFEYTAVGKIEEQYYTANALKIKNDGKLTYEVVVGDAPTADTKGTKVAPTKEVTIKKVKDGQTVYIRIAGDKKKQVWTSDYAKLGVVDFPYTIPKTPAADN